MKNLEQAGIYFQFTVMAVLAFVVLFQVIAGAFIPTIELNEIVLGALIASFLGLPQAFKEKHDE